MKYDVVLIERPHDDANLSRDEIIEITDMLTRTDSIISLEIEGENSVAMGYITDTAFDALDYMSDGLSAFIARILNDMSNENENCEYNYVEQRDNKTTSLNVYLSRNVPSDNDKTLRYPDMTVHITLTDNDIDDLGIRAECNRADAECVAYDIAYDAVCEAIGDTGRLRQLGLTHKNGNRGIDIDRIKRLLDNKS